MFGKRISLFTLFGFEVRLDASWIFIAILIIWSLATGYFPARYSSLSTKAYWIMGTVSALGLFVSIVFHEFCHSLVARKYGMPMKGITLFIFGGVAEMGDEPPEPKVEFLMSAVGPLASLYLSGIFYGMEFFGMRQGWPLEVLGVFSYLSGINALLAGFNLIPAFPLDGGRILRSVLWQTKRDLRWATRISSRIGSGFGVFLVILSVFNIFAGNVIGGVWMFLIGMFLRGAAMMSYQQLMLRHSLEGEPVSRFMKTDVVTVSPFLSIREYVEDYVYRYHFSMFPVLEGNRLLGCITTREVREIPRDEWTKKTVGDIISQACAANTIAPGTDAVAALTAMKQNGITRLLVVDGGRLVGILTLKDLLNFLALKIALEG